VPGYSRSPSAESDLAFITDNFRASEYRETVLSGQRHKICSSFYAPRCLPGGCFWPGPDHDAHKAVGISFFLSDRPTLNGHRVGRSP